MKKPRLLLADDHTILVEGLKALLAPEFDVVATAGDGRAVLEAAKKYQPDIILLDISMPGLNGIEAARRLKQSNPDAKLIILTMHADLSFVSAAFEAGVSGYVLKQSAATELVTALHDVDSGRRYISSLIQKRLGTETAGFLAAAEKALRRSHFQATRGAPVAGGRARSQGNRPNSRRLRQDGGISQAENHRKAGDPHRRRTDGIRHPARDRFCRVDLAIIRRYFKADF